MYSWVLREGGAATCGMDTCRSLLSAWFIQGYTLDIGIVGEFTGSSGYWILGTLDTQNTGCSGYRILWILDTLDTGYSGYWTLWILDTLDSGYSGYWILRILVSYLQVSSLHRDTSGTCSTDNASAASYL